VAQKVTYQFIHLQVEGAVAEIALNRPEKRNALTPEMADEMRDALARCSGEARAVLIRGEGLAFCSGADLSAIHTSGLSGEGAYRSLTEHYNPLLLAIAKHEVPVIAQVHGAAAGIGCSLALACDFCVAAEDSWFALAFVNIGLATDGGASWLLPRLVGKARAAELMMLGDDLPGSKAAEWGLIHDCVPDHALEQEASALARRLANGPTKALAAMKRNLGFALDASLDETMQAEAEAQRDVAVSTDAREGIEAFLQKRAPTFKGQ
jgi:2-(1,2-epoxy-1,2-dihydrophenyl)acetyl-CoA isomerase